MAGGGERLADAGSRPHRPVVIGVLGGIASGKSLVARILGERGAVVLDADALARAALDRPEVAATIARSFGRGVLAPGGGVDREALARAVFADSERLSQLESIVHPLVRAQLDAALEQALREGASPAVVLDVPLLLESSPLARRCDLLLFVESDAADRRRRASGSRGWAPGELARREARQLALPEKRGRADVVLVNDGTEAQLRERVDRWLEGAGGFDGLPRRREPPPQGRPDDERETRRSDRG